METATRRILAVLFLLSFLHASPARAEFPIALRANLGLGPGSGWRDHLGTGPFGGAVFGDLLWRRGPRPAVVLTAEVGGVGCPCLYIPESPRLEGVEYHALTLELERSRPPGAGVATFRRLGAGVAQLQARGFPGIQTTGELRPGLHDSRLFGVALTGTLGFRLVPRPGPVGFVFSVRSSNILARDHRIHAVLFSLGMTIHPLTRERPK